MRTGAQHRHPAWWFNLEAHPDAVGDASADLREFVVHPAHLDAMRRSRPGLRSSNFIMLAHHRRPPADLGNDAADRITTDALRSSPLPGCNVTFLGHHRFALVLRVG